MARRRMNEGITHFQGGMMEVFPVLIEHGLALLTLFIGAIAITCLYLETSRKLIIALFAIALIFSFEAGMAHGVFITIDIVHNQIQREEAE